MTGHGRVLLIVEDDADVRQLLETVMTQAGFVTRAVATGSEAVAVAAEIDPLVITLDISLPDIDGFEVARRIRAFSDAYIVMLTARVDEIDALQGLDAGADDYVTKPFRHRELRARIEAMLRRPRGGEATQPAEAAPGLASDTQPSSAGTDPSAAAAPSAVAVLLRVGEDGHALLVDSRARTVEVDEREVHLTRSEFEILARLVEADGAVATKEELTQLLRGSGELSALTTAESRRLDVHLVNLRRKLGSDSDPAPWIETVRGVGYRLRRR